MVSICLSWDVLSICLTCCAIACVLVVRAVLRCKCSDRWVLPVAAGEALVSIKLAVCWVRVLVHASDLTPRWEEEEVRTTDGESNLRTTFVPPRHRPQYANVTNEALQWASRTYPMCHTPASYPWRDMNTYVRLNVFIHVRLHGLHEYTPVDTEERPFMTDTSRTIWYPGVDLQKTTLEIETCKRWREYESTHMVSRSWSVKDNSIKTSLECHQWSNTWHTFKTTYGISLGRLTPSS